MFSTGEYVVNNTRGLCLIEDICVPETMEKKCYLLRPMLHPNLQIYLPVENADTALRTIMSEDEAQELIDKIASLDIKFIKESRARNLEYKKIINEGSPESLASLVRAYYLKDKYERGTMDNIVFKNAESLLLAELSHVLGKTEKEIKNIIYKKLNIKE